MTRGSTGAVRTGEGPTFQKDHLSSFLVLKSLHCSCLIISFRDAKCGKIQCLTSASKPTENSAVRIDTTVSLGAVTIQCIGTHVYKAGKVDEDTQGDTLDPGLVMTGTKCGVDSVRHQRVSCITDNFASLFFSIMYTFCYASPSSLIPVPILNRFVLMGNVAMHLSSKLTSAIISAMDTG